MRIRIVEVSIPKNEYVDFPNDSHLKQVRKYYKLQTSWLGLVWWDKTDPEYGMVYPTFDTVEEAKDYIRRMYFEQEIVAAEYKTR